MDEEQYVCMEDVRDSALRRELEGYLDPGTCSFCGSGTAGVVSFEVFMEEVMSAVYWRFQRANDAGVPREDGDWAEATMNFHEVVQDTLWGAVDWAVADAVEAYDDGDAWVYRDYPWPNLDVAMRRGWRDFCELVYAHDDAVLLPQEERQWGYGMYGPREVLDHICEMAKRLGLIVPLPEGSRLWRSRIADAPVNCTASEMGPPPVRRAAPNRMSPAGVSMFYAAEDARTAQREVTAHRSDLGAQHLTTCAFSVAHYDCWILDLTDLPEVPSIFDHQQRNLYAFADFMQHFAAELTKPIPLDGTQHREYRPTQVFTQYLYRHAPLGVNGIKFRSAQDSDGINYVLFAGPEDCTDAQSQKPEHLLLIEPATMMHMRIEPSDQESV
ncbi:RES domain-containing protein [Streptomyces minutiscleroticus]|uniref:RES domain-containing protein n=1 Tax=Streptomyces minutiscleroticus TaxID=68238 RepID=UPI00333340B4